MIRLTRVVLPAPVGPTMAMVWPGSATSDRSWIRGLVGSYEKETSLELDAPRHRGQLDRRTGIGALLLGVEQIEDPLGGGEA